MRWMYVALVGVVAIVGVLIMSRGSGGDGKQAAITPIPTPAPITPETVLLGASDLAGCTGGEVNKTLSNAWSRTFTCANGDVMKSVLAIYNDGTEARTAVDQQWGTLDSAREQIKTAIFNRPVNQESLRVVDAAATYPKIGADQETIYCATFTDQAGGIKVVEYYGTLRVGLGVVTYTSYTESAGTCETPPSRALDAAQTVAKTQFQKIKEAAKRQ